MKQLSLFDFMDEPIKEIKIIDTPKEILRTIEQWRGCTSYAFDAIKSSMESYGVYTAKEINYEVFNKLMVNVGLPFRIQNRGVERDYETVESFENGDRLIRFRGREFPVYCLGNKTYEGVKIGEVVR